ncbi:MAG TPA: amidase, partial [Acidimicrobiales bacterium]|nr:amidase [Acidimicrobiales bacterium]
GVSGLKPTFGLVSRVGCVPLAFSYDHVGPLARSAEDCAILLDAISGPDGRNSVGVDWPRVNYTHALHGHLQGMRIGIDRLDGITERRDVLLDARLDEAISVLRDAGAVVSNVTLPLYRELTASNLVGLLSEAFSYHRDTLRRRWADYGVGTRSAIGIGAVISAESYVRAQRVRSEGRRQIAQLFSEVDLILTPTASTEAVPLEGLRSDVVDGLFTPIWNSVGAPALSVPIGFGGSGLPLGLQIIGKPFDDASVLRAGDAYQRRTEWHLRQPEFAGTGGLAS